MHFKACLCIQYSLTDFWRISHCVETSLRNFVAFSIFSIFPVLSGLLLQVKTTETALGVHQKGDRDRVREVTS